MSNAAINVQGRRQSRRSFYLLLLVVVAGVSASVQAQVNTTGDYLQRMDVDGDGRVSVEEYLQWMLYAFDQMDRNGDDVLNADELPGGRGSPITREQQQQTIIERFHKQDANGDGYLSAKELMAPPR